MVLEGLRAYLELASGLTEVTRQRAKDAARALVAQTEAGVDSVVPDQMRARVGELAEELVATSKNNRDLLRTMVRGEVERSVTRLGLVSAAELDAANDRARELDDRVHQLERELRSARKTGKSAKGAATTPAATKGASPPRSAKRAAPKKAAPKKAAPKKAAEKQGTPSEAAASTKRVPAKRASAGSRT